MKLTFEWGFRKTEINFLKHGVRFEEAASIFYDTHALEMRDVKHSQVEAQSIILGVSSLRRIKDRI